MKRIMSNLKNRFLLIISAFSLWNSNQRCLAKVILALSGFFSFELFFYDNTVALFARNAIEICHFDPLRIRHDCIDWGRCLQL